MQINPNTSSSSKAQTSANVGKMAYETPTLKDFGTAEQIAGHLQTTVLAASGVASSHA